MVAISYIMQKGQPFSLSDGFRPVLLSFGCCNCFNKLIISSPASLSSCWFRFFSSTADARTYIEKANAFTRYVRTDCCMYVPTAPTRVPTDVRTHVLHLPTAVPTDVRPFSLYLLL